MSTVMSDVALNEYDIKYGSRLSSLETEVQNLDRKIDSVAIAVKDIAQNLAQMQKAPWQTMIAAGTLIISIMSIVGYLSLQPIINQQKELTHIAMQNNEYRIDYAKEFGIINTKLEELENHIENLEEEKN